MMNTTNNNATINNANKEKMFYEELGRVFAKYYFSEGFPLQKMTFMVNPDFVQTEEPKSTQKEPTKAERLKEYGKNGLNVKNASSIDVSDRAVKLVNEIAAKYDIKIKPAKGGNRKGYLNCQKAAAAIIDRYDDGGKLVDEAIKILIDTEHVNTRHGITRNELELVTRILALHQKRGRVKAKEALVDILTEHISNSILVLAKQTKLYTQRNDIDMMVLYVESEIAKQDGIRNQFNR